MYTEQTKKNIPQSKGIAIYSGTRRIGEVIGNEFHKTIKPNGFLTNPPAIANDIQSLHDAERAGAVYCVFKHAVTGVIYRASIAEIWDGGFKLDRGWGAQIGYPLNRWLQSRDADFLGAIKQKINRDANSKPLLYKSHAIVGVKRTEGKQTAKQLQLKLFRERK